MLQPITINSTDIIREIKLSCQIPGIIEGIVTRKIISAAAAEKGIKVTLEELQQAADNIRLINKLHHAEDTWTWLQKYSLSLDDLEEIAYTNVLSAKLAQHLFTNSIEPFFVEHLLDYAGVIMYEVVLEDQDLALELFYALTEDEISFSEIAREYIQEPELRRCGGYRGILYRKDLKPEISAAVFAATPPQIIKPIISSKKAHLILVEKIIQPQLDNVIRSQILSDLFSEWIKQQIKEIEVLKEFDLISPIFTEEKQPVKL